MGSKYIVTATSPLMVLTKFKHAVGPLPHVHCKTLNNFDLPSDIPQQFTFPSLPICSKIKYVFETPTMSILPSVLEVMSDKTAKDQWTDKQKWEIKF